MIRTNNLNTTWCLACDFNVVRCASKQDGTILQSVTREIAVFDEFMEELGLNDQLLAGRKYTWHRLDRTCMSIIDRFLLSDDWLSQWDDLTRWGLEWTVFDHCAILLKSTSKNWRWGSYVLKEKLKQLKLALKEWNKSSFGNIDENLKAIVTEIKSIDAKGECGAFLEGDKMKRMELFENF